MKTLEEVIKALHYWDTCDVFPESFYDFEVTRDALYHLNKYRMTLDDIVSKRKALEAEIDRYQEAVKNCEEAENRYLKLVHNLGKVGNDPLTWDELREMKGKPVWVETDNAKFWTVVDNFRIICNQECLCCSKGYMCQSTHMRGDWQAYRKERG